MQDETAVNFLARGYGLVLGLALGASAASVPATWRDIAASACWMAMIEVGQEGSAAQCPPSDQWTLAEGPVHVAALGTAAHRP